MVVVVVAVMDVLVVVATWRLYESGDGGFGHRPIKIRRSHNKTTAVYLV